MEFLGSLSVDVHIKKTSDSTCFLFALHSEIHPLSVTYLFPYMQAFGIMNAFTKMNEPCSAWHLHIDKTFEFFNFFFKFLGQRRVSWGYFPGIFCTKVKFIMEDLKEEYF